MQRDLARLSNEYFNLLVIGGGITGACVARDAALRGLTVALIEKNDFACATSAHNSKLIHGGLRYLRNFELGLVRDVVIDAAAPGAAVANHLAAETLLVRNGRVEGAAVSDTFAEARFDIRADATLIAAGPWADIFLAHALGGPASHRLMRSKGIHLIVPAMTRTAALTVAANGGHFFVLPWRKHSLLGTTDTAFADSPDDVGVTENEISDFLGFINAHLPSAKVKREDVQHFYAGLRPLVDDDARSTYSASRRAELIDHGKDDAVEGLFSAIGGKWTTSRHLAEKTVDVIAAKLGKSTHPCATAITKLPGAGFEYRHPDVTRAIHEEMAMTLEDVVMRRTGIRQLG